MECLHNLMETVIWAMWIRAVSLVRVLKQFGRKLKMAYTLDLKLGPKNKLSSRVLWQLSGEGHGTDHCIN